LFFGVHSLRLFNEDEIDWNAPYVSSEIRGEKKEKKGLMND